MSRTINEVVELDRRCDLGVGGERAVVVSLDGKYMTLLFPNRDAKCDRKVNTGADYKFLRSV